VTSKQQAGGSRGSSEMSFWFHRRDNNGRLHLFSVSIPSGCFMCMIGFIVVMIAITAKQWLR